MKQAKVGRNLENLLQIISVSLITLVAFEMLAVATAMPFVVEILDGKNLYALASGVALATQLMTTAFAGVWADARGPKPALYTGMSLFIAGLCIATAAPNMEIVVVGRAVQGLGGGLIIVPLYVLVGAHVRPERQASIFAAFAAAWVIPSLVGPVIAGYLVEYVHWRAVFGLVPLLLIPLFPFLVFQLRKFPNSNRHEPIRQRKILVLAAFGGVAIAFLQVMSGVSHYSAPMIALIAVLAVAIFALLAPVLPKGTYRAKRGVGAVIALRGILNGTYVSVEVFLPLMLKEVHHWGATQAGMVVSIGAITWAVGSWLQGRIVRQRARRKIPAVGTGLELLGMVMTVAAASTNVSGLIAIVGWTVAGFGTGLIYPALTVQALALTPPEHHGSVSSALSIADTAGGAVSVAFAGIAFSLAASLENWAFAVTILFMAAILSIGLAISHRVREVTPTGNNTADSAN